ncbi:MAG: single-stranded DNA-binding protein [Verrucomicrobiae bacterium]|nr:single-stranded DNA-binding protein [Verrucomicrobiae bacterium]NNJ41770.1 single-stranded DNA-binding protein [Akkermansiaceae bacterium]
MSETISHRLIDAAQELIAELKPLRFKAPVSHVYLPTEYAWDRHREYLERFGGGAAAAGGKKRVLMLGMNPGPWGMAQTGVPFGEIPAVRDWMGISGPVDRPENEHPKRPIEGFDCTRSEVSGRRLWGLFSSKFPMPEAFFERHFVANYCPLVWMGETGKNITPDKLPKSEMEPVERACRKHLAAVIAATEPEWLIGVGAYAEKKLIETVREFFPNQVIRTGKILHPSPASPLANRGWEPQAERQLVEMGVWR